MKKKIVIILCIVSSSIFMVWILENATYKVSYQDYIIYNPISVTELYDIPDTAVGDVFSTTMTTTFNDDGTIEKVTCTIEENEKECSELPTYDLLVESTEKLIEFDYNQVIVGETMEKTIFHEQCESTLSGVIPCEEAVTYDKLLQELDYSDKDKRWYFDPGYGTGGFE